MGKKSKKGKGKNQVESMGWVHGKKLEILTSCYEDYKRSKADMVQSTTKALLARFSFDLPFEKDPKEGVNYTPPDINTFPEGPIRKAEEDRQAKVLEERKKKIHNWTNYHWNIKVTKSNEKLVQVTCKTIWDLWEDQLWKRSDWQPGPKQILKPSQMLAEINRFCRERFNNDEDPEFVKRVIAKNTKIYSENMKSMLILVTAMADVVTIHFGVVVTIALHGPRSNGKIKTDIISSLVPCSQTELSFQDFDPDRYAELHNYANDYAAHVFYTDLMQQPAGWEHVSTTDDNSVLVPAAAPVVIPGKVSSLVPGSGPSSNVAQLAMDARSVPGSGPPKSKNVAQPAPSMQNTHHLPPEQQDEAEPVSNLPSPNLGMAGPVLEPASSALHSSMQENPDPITTPHLPSEKSAETESISKLDVTPLVHPAQLDKADLVTTNITGSHLSSTQSVRAEPIMKTDSAPTLSLSAPVEVENHFPTVPPAHAPARYDLWINPTNTVQPHGDYQQQQQQFQYNASYQLQDRDSECMWDDSAGMQTFEKLSLLNILHAPTANSMYYDTGYNYNDSLSYNNAAAFQAHPVSNTGSHQVHWNNCNSSTILPQYSDMGPNHNRYQQLNADYGVRVSMLPFSMASKAQHIPQSDARQLQEVPHIPQSDTQQLQAQPTPQIDVQHPAETQLPSRIDVQHPEEAQPTSQFENPELELRKKRKHTMEEEVLTADAKDLLGTGNCFLPATSRVEGTVIPQRLEAVGGKKKATAGTKGHGQSARKSNDVVASDSNVEKENEEVKTHSKRKRL
ncbi:hypothetical protein Moror_10153 [Moniliophthora roreri MCA 2997]|uniref:Uncharacterized protein n=2 Tax=Moniliophthora roreri TaxID=221103 RepID=V2WS35_MONRO|nr:hypothetical protein Moror_10153 [Moniliophthora roreri MCA 2997]